MRIDDYAFGHVTIDGNRYTSDVIIYPGRVDASWWRKQGHYLQPVDLEEVWREPPEVLVVGTGASGVMKVAPEVEARAEALGIELIVRRSEAACQEFNQLSQGRRVVACLHLTC